ALVHVAVADFITILEGQIPHVEYAVTVQAVHGRERALLQSRRRHYHLEHGAGSVLALQGSIHQRSERIPNDLEPLLLVEVAGEAIELEGGARGHGENIAIAGIHDDDRPRSADHSALRRFL